MEDRVREARERRGVLVTGSHRSGTSWVGHMLCLSSSPPLGYLWEPFSLLHEPGVCRARFANWFTYVCEDNAGAYRDPIAETLTFRYQTGHELRHLRRPKGAARFIRDRARFARWRREGARPLFKDPIAVFSAEWLAEQFGMDVVVMIRHPAGFAASLKRLRWVHPFEHFLNQPLLMRDVLRPFRDEIRDFAEHERDIVDQASLLWRLVHHAVLGYRRRQPGWMFVRHEDASRDPVGSFERMYRSLGLRFDENVRAGILAHSASSNPVTTSDPSVVKRASEANVWSWKNVLTPAEIARVRRECEPIASEFYADGDWEPPEPAPSVRSRSD